MDKDSSPKILGIERSALFTVLGIVFLFSFAIIITLLAPRHLDSTWTQPTSPYQVQMYEIQDPNLYLSSTSDAGRTLEYVDHLKKNFSLLAFVETATTKIIAPSHLEKFITKQEDKTLKLSSSLLLLRRIDEAKIEGDYNPFEKAKKLLDEEGEDFRLAFAIYELYDPEKEEVFARSFHDGILGEWVDENFVILDESPKQKYHEDLGVLFIKNPTEFRVIKTQNFGKPSWHYSQDGESISSLKELKEKPFYFHSRQELIAEGEHIFAIEGCWYCHTDQTRTLVQDLVLNGSPDYPAPPSSANEYIYQKITFPGTRRIGPDLSRVAIKRPARDWHMSHFWSPRTESPGSVMPAFGHFFDKDPRGGSGPVPGIPNYRFEAVFQYLMTKGSRITAPTEAWWEGKDPVNTLKIIQGQTDGS